MIIKMGYSGMTKEEKDLLLKDLSARLPYDVICNSVYVMRDDVDGNDVEYNQEGKIESISIERVFINGYPCDLDRTKPYLRPMSSMTEEEFKEYHSMLIDIDNSGLMNQGLITKMVDWLDEKMFDHRNLVPKGLALVAPMDMYKIE